MVSESEGAYKADTELHGAATTGGDPVCKPPGVYPEKTVEYVGDTLDLGSVAVSVAAAKRNAVGAGWTACAWLVWAMSSA